MNFGVGEPCALSIAVMYDTIEGGAQARQHAENVVGKQRELFEQTYGKPDCASEIAFDACEAVADTSVTPADLSTWRSGSAFLDSGISG